jgi:GTP-binding protein
MSAKFIKSASDLTGWPETRLPEVGIVGRSNAGKSSVVNALTNHKKLAKVSSTPGKTALLNFFEIDKKFILVDMPGYGYASRARTERQMWTDMIESYLASRQQLRGVMLVIDCQRPWSQDESNLVTWLNDYDVNVMLVVNKIDKLNQKELNIMKQHYSKVDIVQGICYVSASQKKGFQELNQKIFNLFIKQSGESES